jgi:hypothetical protein
MEKKEAKQFVTGFGQFDTRKNTNELYKTITFAQIAKLTETPGAKPKGEAQWTILSTYIAADARKHDQQRSFGKFYALAGDIDEGNPTKKEVIAALESIIGNSTRIIYSTSGSTDQNKKWRFLIPIKNWISGALYGDAQRALFDLINAQGIKCDLALARPGQPIYLPNVPMDKRNAAAIPFFYEYEINRGIGLFDFYKSTVEEKAYQNFRADVARQEAALEAAKLRASQREKSGFNDDGSVAWEFNARHTIEQLFDKYGYARLGASDQFRSKYQSSGSFATKSFGDYWVSLSASDAGAGLGTSKEGYCWGDLFDLYCHYEHGGDFKAAVRTYGQEINPSNPTAAQVLKPLLGAWDGPLPYTEAQGAPETAQEGGPTISAPGMSQMKQHRAFDLESAAPVLSSSYLVKGWLGKAQMSVVYGPSNVGKSFFCLDLAFAIAANQQWNGCKVRGGAVLYLATEGGNAFRGRVYALKIAKGIDKAPLIVRPSPIDLLRAEVDMPSLAELCKEITDVYGRIEMIVVDTLSRAMAGGNENGPEDMTRLIGNLDVLRDLTGAHIMVVHHSGKDTAAGARGHSSLRAATDTEIELEVDDGLRLAKTTKQRDMEPKPPLGFKLVVHELGQDEDGDPVTTCTIEIADADDVREMTDRKPLGKNERKIIECFNMIRVEGGGKGNPGGEGFPMPGAFCVIDRDRVQTLFEGRVTVFRADKAFAKALETLINKGEMCLNMGLLWIPKKKGMM